MFMKKIGDLTAQNSELVKLSDKEIDVNEDLPEHEKKKIFIKELQGPLFFGSTSEFQNMIGQIPSTATIMILRMTKVPYIDQSGIFAMENVIKESENTGRLVLISGLQKQPSEILRKLKVIPNLVSEHHNFYSFRDCIAWIRNEHLV
jgi:SulP family sulfate permease